MNDEMTPDAELISRVLETAESEAASIREEAEKSLADRRASLEQRLDKIRQEAEARVSEETERLSSRADATIELERNRSQLRTESRIYRTVDEKAREALRRRRDTSDYADILRRWIVEAVLGLGATEATVACPAEDREVVKAVLGSAVAELSKAHDLEVKLTLDEETQVDGQGVVLRNVPPTMAYSNTVDDRMRRLSTRIHAMVYREVIEEADE